MSEPIKAGDLVVVVRPSVCCAGGKAIGEIHTVSGFFDGLQCENCGTTLTVPSVLIDGVFRAFAISRLKRIPPLDELERDQIVEELSNVR